jgi:hypothetical protein
MLRKILSLVLNCEKEKNKKDTGETGTTAAEYRKSKPSTKVDIRHSTEKIPDPWFN